MTAASKSQLEMNAAAVLAELSRPANDTLSMYGECCLERQMFGEMEMTFPMKVTLPLKRLNFPNSSLSCNLTSFFIKNEVQLLSSRERSIKYQ